MTRIAPVIQLGDRRRGESGQMLIIMVFALIVMLVFAGLVIDGGYAWTQQRNTQNAADSIAQSGTVVIAERLVGGVRTGADIITAMDRAAAANSPGGSTYTAYYTAGTTGDANIGYLDLGTGNLQQQIANPSNTAFSLPTWLQAQTGAVNATQDELRAYNGQVVLVPMYDGTCRVQPAGTDLSDCPPGEEGVGNNTFYHIPQFAAFLVYNSYTQGVDKTACEQAPGYPRGDLGGKTGCIKGWFVRYITQGPVGVDTGGYENSPASMGIQLVK